MPPRAAAAAFVDVHLRPEHALGWGVPTGCVCVQTAFGIIEEAIGAPLEQVFSQISASPVAAASLGQVYRATLQGTGEEVAVKVLTCFALLSLVWPGPAHTRTFFYVFQVVDITSWISSSWSPC